ncbi:RNA-binding protein MEX3B-like [Mixophyes fleayi]|uniref:RNA-binding protein MEX3B-like n=1 Tax=Mixophyes fleayi TaxID=3061075 RepID=UPI003F4D77B1
MTEESLSIHQSPEGGRTCAQPLWEAVYDVNAHGVQQTKGVADENAHDSRTSRGGNRSMQEPRGEEEPGGEGPRGPHEGDTEGETGTRGPNKEHAKHQTPLTAGVQLSYWNHVSKDAVQEPVLSLGPQDSHTSGEPALEHNHLDPQHPPAKVCLRQEHVFSVHKAPDHTEPKHEQHSPQPTGTSPQHAACVLPPGEAQVNLTQPTLSQVPLQAYERDAQPGALESALLFPTTSNTTTVPHFPQLPTDEEFQLMLNPLSVLGLQDGQDEDEFGSENAGSGPPSPEPGDIFGEVAADHLLASGARRRGINMTEGVPVPSSEHVAEIVGRQGCKIKALRAKTNTYIKTPVRGEEPVFIVTGRKEDVEMAKQEILAAAEHFSIIRATRNKINGIPGGATQGPPNLPGQTTIQVRVPYRVVGLVVGPKGATIKRIQQSTHTYIVTPSRDKEPVFEVTGMPENVDRAREEIEAHITMRTGSLVDFHPESDFHSNGTDVCMDLLGGGSGNLWAKMSAPRRDSNGSRNESLRSSSVESPYLGTGGREQGPRSPLRSVLGRTFPLGAEPHTGQAAVGIEDCEFGFEFLALDLNTPTAVWSSFETQIQNFNGCPAQRRNSGMSGSATPLLSPTLPDPGIGLEHPLARRIHSDPVNSISWLPNQGSLSSFSNSAGYSSSSSLPGSSSVASGSPTDSSSSDGQRKSGRDCVVCYESEVIAALVPCGHNLFCMECAIRICERVLPECPACHTPATQAIRIFS